MSMYIALFCALHGLFPGTDCGVGMGDDYTRPLKPTTDAVSPTHYRDLDPEPITVIQAWKLSFCLGNVVKYIARAGRKDPAKHIEDLRKARQYLDFEIAALEGSSK